jgi:hypothetical protein
MKSKPEKLLSNCREGGKIKMFSTWGGIRAWKSFKEFL